ncbi:MAG TPA: DUF4870 domain-containing protein [Segeticoccus sp.]|uniref:DUF4870 domain-containing protein n=1 Tax=Segeticoccus sp. TaxID=2706531 RepID=UPI002D7F714E|nr:DUF4870 domain-containing protein [Segeticoccus sp.]HET8599578.1 DUF4870 domain-containing protein [Segeticoccus sp.]
MSEQPQHTPPPGPEGPYPGQPYPPPPPGAGYVTPMSPQDQRTWGMIAHLAPFVGSLVGLPFLGSLVVYLIYKDRGAFVRMHSAESLNFQLTLLIGYAIAAILIVVLIGIVLLPLLWIGSIVLQIVAAVAANNGQEYRYPLTIRFVR